ncbi:unnamed protein product [Arctogadus glacialis]
MHCMCFLVHRCSLTYLWDRGPALALSLRTTWTKNLRINGRLVVEGRERRMEEGGKAARTGGREGSEDPEEGGKAARSGGGKEGSGDRRREGRE